MEGYKGEPLRRIEGLNSPKAIELFEKIDTADIDGLVALLVETVTAKMRLREDLETEITEQEAELITLVIDFKLHELLDK